MRNKEYLTCEMFLPSILRFMMNDCVLRYTKFIKTGWMPFRRVVLGIHNAINIQLCILVILL